MSERIIDLYQIFQRFFFPYCLFISIFSLILFLNLSVIKEKTKKRQQSLNLLKKYGLLKAKYPYPVYFMTFQLYYVALTETFLVMLLLKQLTWTMSLLSLGGIYGFQLFFWYSKRKFVKNESRIHLLLMSIGMLLLLYSVAFYYWFNWATLKAVFSILFILVSSVPLHFCLAALHSYAFRKRW